MSHALLVDHAGMILFYDAGRNVIVRGAGNHHSSSVLPVYYDGTSLAIMSGNAIKTIENCKVRQEEIVRGVERVSLSVDGLFGAAEPENWDVMFSRSQVSGWEIFVCRPVSYENVLRDLSRSRWVSAHDGRVHEPGDITEEGNGILISGKYYDGVENKGAISALSLSDKEIRLSRGVVSERYIRFSPLIYCVAFGSEQQRDCVAISLRSFVEIGNYTGDFCVITDRDDMESVRPEGFTGKLHIIRASASSRTQMWQARYSIVEMESLGDYQPVIYVDTDVVCNDAIDPLLTRVLLAPGICVGVENHPGVVINPSRYRESDAVGKLLFERDGFFPEDEYGFNSGVIGLPSMSTGHADFRVVSSVLDQMMRVGFESGWADQAVLNYVLHKHRTVDTRTLSARIAVGTASAVHPFTGSGDLPVLIHFWSTFAHDRVRCLTDHVEARIKAMRALP